MQVTGRAPKMLRISGVASLAKCLSKQLLERARHLFIQTFGSALYAYYIIFKVNFNTDIRDIRLVVDCRTE